MPPSFKNDWLHGILCLSTCDILSWIQDREQQERQQSTIVTKDQETMTPFSDELQEQIERLEEEKSLLITELNLKHNANVSLHLELKKNNICNYYL